MEILGKVNQDLSIQLFTAIDFGSNIGITTLEVCAELILDFKTVDALVEIVQQNREIFY